MAQKIYFDESGFTGTNLLNQDQTVFTYAAIGVDNIKAIEIINKIKLRYPTQAPELKFKNYVKSTKCDEFCLFVINLIKNYSGVVVFDNNFALCSIFFEYMFEPVIAYVNLFFYAANFHLYMTYKIYDLLGNINQITLLTDFENVMKHDKKDEKFNKFLKAIKPDSAILRKSKRTFEEKVYTFISLNKSIIQEELQSLSGDTPTCKYILDLTTTAFLGLCGFLTEKFGGVEPIYDESKMMDAHKNIFDGFVGREIEFEVPRFDRKFKVHITKELVSANSKLEPAIQLADLLAGITSYAYSNANQVIIDSLSENGLIASAIIPRTIEMDIINLFPNEYEEILNILVKRSVANKQLFDENLRIKLWVLAESCKEILKRHKEKLTDNIMSQIS